MEETKAGKKTSEFWLTVIVIGVIIANQVLKIGLEIGDILMIAGLDGVYAVSRSIAKK